MIVEEINNFFFKNKHVVNIIMLISFYDIKKWPYRY